MQGIKLTSRLQSSGVMKRVPTSAGAEVVHSHIFDVWNEEFCRPLHKFSTCLVCSCSRLQLLLLAGTRGLNQTNHYQGESSLPSFQFSLPFPPLSSLSSGAPWAGRLQFVKQFYQKYAGVVKHQSRYTNLTKCADITPLVQRLSLADYIGKVRYLKKTFKLLAHHILSWKSSSPSLLLRLKQTVSRTVFRIKLSCRKYTKCAFYSMLIWKYAVEKAFCCVLNKANKTINSLDIYQSPSPLFYQFLLLPPPPLPSSQVPQRARGLEYRVAYWINQVTYLIFRVSFLFSVVPSLPPFLARAGRVRVGFAVLEINRWRNGVIGSGK